VRVLWPFCFSSGFPNVSAFLDESSFAPSTRTCWTFNSSFFVPVPVFNPHFYTRWCLDPALKNRFLACFKVLTATIIQCVDVDQLQTTRRSGLLRSAPAAPYQQKDGGFTPYIFLLLMLHGMHVSLGGILPLELRRF
jgi:hypothetical protein